MNNLVKPVINLYNKLSNVGKTLIFIVFLLIIIIFFKKTRKEGFIQKNEFLFKKGSDIYDDFYASIYDYLVFNPVKNDYEVGTIINQEVANTKSVILDVGSGTGHHVAKLAENGLDVIGIDNSQAMIEQSKKNYPKYNYQKGDVLNAYEFKHHTFTHILCMYFTIYYLDNKMKFFNNCIEWLKPGGFLIVHLVDRSKFDPILPPGNPLYIVSPQKYAKERITKTKIKFNEFEYSSNFQLNDSSNIAIFDEKFKFNDGKVRKQEHTLYMEPIDDIINMAQEAGFIIQGKIDLVKVAYEYQYLYIFLKPN